MKIKLGDTVLVLSGKDRTKKGKVIRAIPEVRKIMVEGLNLRKKHKRPTKSGQKGQIITIPASLHVAKVKLICPKCSKPTRVGYIVHGKKKFRTCKKCKAEF